jgi:4-amino-4-deoxy-L-arabinose transferase-like glycosyltransferase
VTGLVARAKRFALPGLLVLAALLRLPNLATRGTWDGDQGHDMLVLRTFVKDGLVPLLGPPTSIGEVHHGAWYYYLLAPAAVWTGGDSPFAVVLLIAAAGIAAVGVVWWLARSVAGPIAGIVAGLLMALSAAAVDESTFIWNPNLIALSSAIAVAAAWHAWSGGDRRWWLVAAIGAAVTMQCHVLGVALAPIVAAPLLLDARRRPLGTAVPLGILAVFVIAYLPLAINELTTGFSEVRAAIDYLAGDRAATEVAIPVRFGIVGLRVLSWPLTGLISDGFIAGSLATVAVIAIVVWRWRAADTAERFVTRWFGLGLLWTVAFLTIAAPSLVVVVRGLPNDHYHAFADPLVFVLAGIGAAALVREGRPPVRGRQLVAATAVGVLLVWNAAHQPSAVHPDGGYPAGQLAGDRVDTALSGAGLGLERAVRLVSLPDFKSTEALAYPLARLERAFIATLLEGKPVPGSVAGAGAGALTPLVVMCDQLFRDAIGADCGGPAENATAPDAGGADNGPLLDRFEAAPGRWISVYGPPTS